MTQEELNKVIENHKHWLNEDCHGWENMRANLDGEILSFLNLDGASLNGASLNRASLNGASLIRASLNRASLNRAKDIPFIPIACPSDGEFIGWKKVGGNLIKLRIPEDARRCSATTEKCRCDKAFVMGIFNLDGTDSELTEIINLNYEPTIYKVGEMVYPDSFDDNRWDECSHGIHFFINKENAIRY